MLALVVAPCLFTESVLELSLAIATKLLANFVVSHGTPLITLLKIRTGALSCLLSNLFM